MNTSSGAARSASSRGSSDLPCINLEQQFPYRIVSDAIAAIDGRDPDRHFFTWVSFPEPHNPYQAPGPYFSMFAPEDAPGRACGPEAAETKSGT